MRVYANRCLRDRQLRSRSFALLRRQRLWLARARRSLAYASDRYTFTGVAGQLAPLSLNLTAFDPYLYLIGLDGAVLAEDDDGGDALNARIPAGSGFSRLARERRLHD